MKFELRKWQPQVFKAETATAVTALVTLATVIFGWPVEVAGPVGLILSYGAGFATVRSD